MFVIWPPKVGCFPGRSPLFSPWPFLPFFVVIISMIGISFSFEILLFFCFFWLPLESFLPSTFPCGVVGNTVGFHPATPGSIPGKGALLLFFFFLLF